MAMTAEAAAFSASGEQEGREGGQEEVRPRGGAETRAPDDGSALGPPVVTAVATRGSGVQARHAICRPCTEPVVFTLAAPFSPIEGEPAPPPRRAAPGAPRRR
ncbi:unnamed protein product [Prorocentrum cordatum]|uniref:Uncharacterized protein n=1 Tax=Prorocentrum cordatum TaxID=2364126 RepID=A0ABN9XVR2_9DINO|nr:unnamed protein product [Polarella glacialis]